ncbi:MAG: family 2 glycosyl transferase [Bacteroidetes bacterium]|nr:family 2 glycosyl transferase [Bacteroidota bacterium]
MSVSPLISVIMPAYNCENYVRKAIDSILNQTYGNLELLIADDCSKDNTKSIIDSYKDSRIKTFHNEVNLGYLKASNKLFKKCSGEYITFQDADDYSDHSRFEKLLAFLYNNPAVACVGSNIVKVDPQGDYLSKSNFPLSDSEIRNAFGSYKVVFTGSALMMKREVVDKVGIYNEYFDRVGAEDIYMYSHILNHFKTANLSDELYFYRANPNSVTATHKNPKALVTGELSVRYYQNRLKGKPDHISSGQWTTADAWVRYMLAIRKLDSSIKSSLLEFLIAFFKSPFQLPAFLREYLSKLKLKLTR